MTQGLLSITKNGETVMKIIAGCDGYNIDSLLNLVKLEHDFSDPEIFYKMALNVGFGCNNCLATMTEDRIIFKGKEEPPSRYGKTFHLPKFNPRWTYGTADYTEILEIGEKEDKRLKNEKN